MLQFNRLLAQVPALLLLLGLFLCLRCAMLSQCQALCMKHLLRGTVASMLC